MLREQSAFWPYLALLPALNDIKPPLGYGPRELELLQGSVVRRAVVDYQVYCIRTAPDTTLGRPGLARSIAQHCAFAL